MGRHGIPDGLAGDAIPLGARVIAVCDGYDAMTSARPYREALHPDEALAELRRCAGTQFDPEVVAAFDALMSGERGAFDTPPSPEVVPSALSNLTGARQFGETPIHLHDLDALARRGDR